MKNMQTKHSLYRAKEFIKRQRNLSYGKGIHHTVKESTNLFSPYYIIRSVFLYKFEKEFAVQNFK